MSPERAGAAPESIFGPDEIAPSPDEIPRRLPASERSFDWLRVILGIRRSFIVGGAKYKELSAEPLPRALSRRGSGAKEFAVSFPGGRRMRITATPQRVFEDLSGPLLLGEYRLASPFIRPGMRVVALRSGTGYAGAWLAGMVGPSGSVVALDPDQESIRFARWRYRLSNVSFEVGDHTALAGEIEGAFDAALAIRALGEGGEHAALGELWRVIAPGGSVIVTAPSQPREPDDPARAMTSEALAACLAASVPRPATSKDEPFTEPDGRPGSAPSAPLPKSPEIQILEAPVDTAAIAARKPAPAS